MQRIATRRTWSRLNAGAAAGIAAGLVGCSAPPPDVAPFTQATLVVANAVEHAGAELDRDLARLVELGVAEAQPVQTRFADDWSQRERTLDAVAAYAEGLQQVVQASTDAEASVDAFIERVETLAAAAGAPVPASGAAVAQLTGAAREIAVAVVRARAASTLEDAIRDAEPAVQEIATLIGEDLAVLRDTAAVTTELLRDYDAAERAYATGDAERSLSLARTDASFRLSVLDELAMMAMQQRYGEEYFQKRESLERTLEQLAPRHDIWLARRAELDAKLRAYEQAVDEAGAALAAWAEAHSELAAALGQRRAPDLAALAVATRRLVRTVESLGLLD